MTIGYKVYKQDGRYRIQLKGSSVNMDVGAWDTPTEVEQYLQWCCGTRWNGAHLRKMTEIDDLKLIAEPKRPEITAPIAEPSEEVQKIARELYRRLTG